MALKLISLLGIALCLFDGTFTYAEPPSTLSQWGEWTNAKELYDSGQFDRALEAFQRAPTNTSAYYYNLGNTYQRLGQPAKAIAYLEKAKTLSPYDTDILYNLTQLQRASPLSTNHLAPPSTWIETLKDLFLAEMTRISFLFIALVLTALCFRVYLKTRNLKKTLQHWSGIPCLIMLTLNFGAFFLHKDSSKSTVAISLIRQEVRSGPGNHFQPLSQLEEGSRLRLLGNAVSSNDSADHSPEVWHQVRYSIDGIGWIKSLDLLIL